ncbi:MAG: efflux RND transporter periplasmic adaptor subunit [Alphaproteobacteria bacterium]|nr:efflux RND transporter periplasmic adaptor subunit [Alphaproteobacteria bacterium]
MGISVVVGLWMLSGIFRPPHPDSQLGKPALQPVKVAVQATEPQKRQRRVVIYGNAEASEKVRLLAETAGTVIAIPAKEGQYLKKGDPIVQIDMRDRDAQKRRAQAKLKQAEIAVKAARELQKKGYTPRVGAADAEAMYEQAKADLAQINQDISHTTIRAPFDGVVDKITVSLGDALGQMMMMETPWVATFIQPDPMKVAGQASEQDMKLLEQGTEVEVAFANNFTTNGKLTFLSQVADSKTRSYRVEATVTNPRGEDGLFKIPDGLTAELRIAAKEVVAYRIPSSALSLGTDGAVGIKDVDAEGAVRFLPVTILEDTPEGMWVALKNGESTPLKLITRGQAFVTAGQKVDAVEEKPEKTKEENTEIP